MSITGLGNLENSKWLSHYDFIISFTISDMRLVDYDIFA